MSSTPKQLLLASLQVQPARTSLLSFQSIPDPQQMPKSLLYIRLTGVSVTDFPSWELQ